MAGQLIDIPTLETDLTPGVLIPLGSAGTWWRVLEVDLEAGRGLVIADRIICEKPYQEQYKAITWEKCSLRAWLNGEYLQNTFTEEEQAAIAESHLSNPDNPKYHISGGNDATDRIFLLSIEEVNRYLKTNKDREADAWWWLRSPGIHGEHAAGVYGDGSVDAIGRHVDRHLGVRPAFRINLDSTVFQSLILKKTESQICLAIPQYVILNGRLIGAHPDCDYTKITLPEGITEIGARFFAGTNIQSVVFPSTLKKIGKEAFCDCGNLQTITCHSNMVSYGQDVFERCNKLRYTPELFHTSGKLSDSFAKHLDVCGMEELAWVLMYQKEEHWEEALEKSLMQDTIPQVLFFMTEHIKGVKSPKKAASGAASFVRTFCFKISGEEIKTFCDVLRSRKLTDLADELLRDPAIFSRLNKNRGEDEWVLSNGTILWGRVETPVIPGIHIAMGNEGIYWKVLSIDEEAGTALVTADRVICKKRYHERYKDVTWEECSLRFGLTESISEMRLW